MATKCKFTVHRRQASLFPVDEGPSLFPTSSDEGFNFSDEGYAQAVRAAEKLSSEGSGEVAVKLVCAKGSASLAFCENGKCKVDAGGTRSVETLGKLNAG